MKLFFETVRRRCTPFWGGRGGEGVGLAACLLSLCVLELSVPVDHFFSRIFSLKSVSNGQKYCRKTGTPGSSSALLSLQSRTFCFPLNAHCSKMRACVPVCRCTLRHLNPLNATYRDRANAFIYPIFILWICAQSASKMIARYARSPHAFRFLSAPHTNAHNSILSFECERRQSRIAFAYLKIYRKVLIVDSWRSTFDDEQKRTVRTQTHSAMTRYHYNSHIYFVWSTQVNCNCTAHRAAVTTPSAELTWRISNATPPPPPPPNADNVPTASSFHSSF